MFPTPSPPYKSELSCICACYKFARHLLRADVFKAHARVSVDLYICITYLTVSFSLQKRVGGRLFHSQISMR